MIWNIMEIEGFIEDEIENIMGLIKQNKEFILNPRKNGTT